ncbi:MAG: hypothetical protein FJ144_27165 [Deltaproteobacteria bacterium]|nr:hypothetical protein [Deltaproteobacteria bacterium]
MPPVSTFIGRDDEVIRLVRLVAERRMVTVVGPGGIGKTRLAKEIGSWLGEAFPDGIRRCELAPISPRDDIGAEVAGELGLASLEALVLGLGDARCLVVLDNCEHVLRTTADLSATLLARCTHIHLLATSREPLGVDGEHVLLLGPLGVPTTADPEEIGSAPAVRLFADRARAAGARWDAARDQVDAVAELCRRLDGIPLAIELAAARARAMTPVELLGHLDRRFELLRRTQPVGDARHGCLRAAIDASYALLEPGEQISFRALGVFAGPFDAELAHAVSSPPGADLLDTLDLLSRLVDRSLVVADPRAGVTRYRLLDSLRHYCEEQARAAGEWDRLLGRFVDAMIEEADRIVAAGSTRWTPDVLETIMTHLANLVAATEACVDGDRDASRAFRLMLPLWGAIHQGPVEEILALCGRVLARWPQGDEPFRAEATAVAVNVSLVGGEVGRAVELATALLRRPEATSLARMIALRTLGLVAHHAGRDEQAAAYFEEGRSAAAATGMAAFERELIISLAAVKGGTGQLAQALVMLDEVTTWAGHENDALNQVWARLVAAQLFVVAGRLEDAARALEAVEAVRAHFGYGSFEHPFGLKAADRLRATLATLDRGWPATRAEWLGVIDRIAAVGDVGQLATNLRAAAGLAGRDGDRVAVEALLAAVPGGRHVTVLPVLFEEELGAYPLPTAASPVGSGEALRRAREVLAARDANAEAAHPIDREEAPARTPQPGAAMQHAGDGWNVTWGGRTVHVRPLKGLDDLAVLLGRPNEEVHCLELIGATSAGGEAVPALDDRARREYQARIRDLQAEIDAARAANDPGPVERAEAELESLVQQLSAAFGLSGRSRTTGSALERARSAVTWRIRAAVKRLGEAHPELGRHLQNAVRTGSWCSYRPENETAWRIETAR